MISVLSIGLLVAADRVCKLLAELLLADGHTVTLIPGVLGLRLLKGGNSGAAFGLLDGKTWLLSIFSVLCALILLYMILCRKTTSGLAHVSLVLLAAGALGNLYDRMVYRSVTDYLEFLFMEFPIFNLADVLVDTGAILLVLYILFLQKDDPFFVPRKSPDENG